jgi:FlaG/FlaF family flagellin (archaellin)
MRSAYNFNPEFSCFCLAPNLRHKAGLVLAFVVFGSIAGASGVVLQMTGHEPNADGRSVIAAIPLNPSATLSTVVSPAFSAVSAPDNRQSGSPANSAQAAPVDAITAAVTAPATTSATELSQQPVAASRKTRRAARNGATGAGTTLLRGANSMRITGAGAATAMNDQVRAGDRPPDRQGDWARTAGLVLRANEVIGKQLGDRASRSDHHAGGAAQAIYFQQFFVSAGGLVSYGFDPIDPHRRAAAYVDRAVLRLITSSNLVATCHWKIAGLFTLEDALGLDVPQTLLATADEVIE